MSEPIISPWIIYIGGILPDLKFLCVLVMIIGGIILPPCLLEGVRYKYKKYIIIGLMMDLLGCVFVPSQQTYYEIVVANYVTYENVNGAKDIEVILNKIIETAQKIKEK